MNMHATRPLLTILALLLFTAGSSSAQVGAWQEPYDRGRELLKARDVAAALEAFAEAVELAKGHCMPCLLGLAQASGWAGDRAASADASRRVLAASREPKELRQALMFLREFAEHDADDPLTLEREIADGLVWLVELTDGRHTGDLEYLFRTLARLKNEDAIVELAQNHLADGGIQRRALLCAVDQRGGLRGPEDRLDPGQETLGSEQLARINEALQSTEWPGPFFQTEDTSIPEALYRLSITVPAELHPGASSARRYRPVRFVRMRAVLEANGTLVAPWVRHTPSTTFSELVLATMEEWRFEPATVDGHSLDLCLNLAVKLSV